ncbi:hypothetical protein BDA99DRAFT_555875 [Phascolomyces articulosus]|uniref:Uncharacterized protein n=1 Tax=Phascolomyces articulosus TaxID=60185 RepID=A0AAD5PIE8_9FUNG|nr:hypothetical protein BDA99DRAFT_555875 [Phascolomyces articulosus]
MTHTLIYQFGELKTDSVLYHEGRKWGSDRFISVIVSHCVINSYVAGYQQQQQQQQGCAERFPSYYLIWYLKFEQSGREQLSSAQKKLLCYILIFKSIELSFLWNKNPDEHWKKLSTRNQFYQLYNKLKKSPKPPNDLISATIQQKRDEEFKLLKDKFKTISCMRDIRVVEPIMYLELPSKDRHRMIKWRMHWLPSYPIKTCRCGEINATREHYKICPRLQLLLLKLLDYYGTIPDLKYPVQPLDYILNNLPRNEVVLGNKRWIKAWPALIRVLREIDFLSHADADFNLDDEPDPEVTMKQQQNNIQS